MCNYTISGSSEHKVETRARLLTVYVKWNLGRTEHEPNTRACTWPCTFALLDRLKHGLEHGRVPDRVAH